MQRQFYMYAGRFAHRLCTSRQGNLGLEVTNEKPLLAVLVRGSAAKSTPHRDWQPLRRLASVGREPRHLPVARS